MVLRLRFLVPLAGLLVTAAPANAGKWGFADKEGGGKSDPVIEVFASVAPNSGQRFSMSPEQANANYTIDPTTIPAVQPAPAGQPSILFKLQNPTPVIPQNADGANEFVMIKFPMKISSKKVRNSLIKNKASLAATSFLTENLTITDEMGNHVSGIAVIGGKTADNKKVSKRVDFPQFPIFIDNKGKNRLLGNQVLTYVADDGDGLFNTISAFGGGGNPEVSEILELRIRLKEVGGVIVNGFWVLKIGNAGTPVDAGMLAVAGVTPKQPITPAEFATNGNQKVEAFSSYVLTYSEPVVPESVGISSDQVKAFNADNPTVKLFFNGNTNLIPNPEDLKVPLYPNFSLAAMHKSAPLAVPFLIPFDVRPINPNNLSEYVVSPLLDLPGALDILLNSLLFSANLNNSSYLQASGMPPPAPAFVPITIQTAASTLYDVRYDNALMEVVPAFRTKGGRSFVNVPVSPQTIYYVPLSGSGAGAINLDGNGYETNDPSTEKLTILTNLMELTTCPFGAFILGCNKNTFGDGTAMMPIGIGGNPPELMGPTPVPGVNEGSVGTTANGTNPNSVFGRGFETVCRDSSGNPRLNSSPSLGSIGDIQVADFLDKVFFDTLNPGASVANHVSFVTGSALLQNSISDPPSPNPPPLRLPVGLQPVDIVFNQQKIKQPAFVIEGDEVFSAVGGIPLTRILAIPNLTNPIAGDTFPTFGQNGPQYQTFGAAGAFAARQQIGNYLYMTDRDNGVVQCVNSNNFSVLASIETPDPEGLGLAPDLRTLYVSNFGDDSVSVIGVDPLSPFFHKEVNRIKVGSGPRDVAVQPENDDVFVSNFNGDSVSIISPVTQTVRKTLSDLISRPWEVVVTPRLLTTGWGSLVYFAYIGNQGSGDVVVYESGPSGSTGFGADALRWAVQTGESFAEMRGLAYDPGTFPGSAAVLPTGVYVTHRDADTGLAMITRVAFTAQLPAFGGFPPVPLPSSVLNAPGNIQREFKPVGTWGGPLVSLQQQLNFGGQDQVPYDVALNDFSARDFFAIVPAGTRTNIGGLGATPTPAAGGVNSKHPYRVVNGVIVPTWVPDRLYVSFPGDSLVEVLDAQNSGAVVNRVTDVPVVGRLATYFDQ